MVNQAHSMDEIIERLIDAVPVEDAILNVLADYKYEVIVEILKLPGVTNAVLASIPDDWEHRGTLWGENPTKREIAIHYLLDCMTPEEKEE
jgi:hypothetical protein